MKKEKNYYFKSQQDLRRYLLFYDDKLCIPKKIKFKYFINLKFIKIIIFFKKIFSFNFVIIFIYIEYFGKFNPVKIMRLFYIIAF